MTYLEIKEEVRRRIEEVSATLWTDEEIAQAIADGEDEIADATEWYERFQVITLLPHRPYYDLRSVLNRPFLVAGPAFNETTTRWLIPASTGELEGGDLRWEERYAEPEFQLTRGLWWCGYWPVSPTGGSLIKQYYRALPQHMSEDSDEPGFHRTFHYGLVEFAVCDLLAQDAETSLAMAAWKLYQGFEMGLAGYVGHRGAVPQMHGHRPDTRIDG